MLERAGADAAQIEDQVFPKRCGALRQPRLAGVDPRDAACALGALRANAQVGDAATLAVDFSERQRLIDKPAWDALEKSYKG